MRPFENIKVNFFTVAGVGTELINTVLKVIPCIGIAAIFSALYVVASLMMKDGTLSKPWLGLIGVSVTIIAIQAGYGLLFWLEVPLNSLSMVVPILLLGESRLWEQRNINCCTTDASYVCISGIRVKNVKTVI